MPDNIRNMLCLSTKHVPGPKDPDFGPFRSVVTEYGWIVWPYFGCDESKIPDWFRPIFEVARLTGAVCVEFDADNNTGKGLEVYEW